jgi:hypothetical protein
MNRTVVAAALACSLLSAAPGFAQVSLDTLGIAPLNPTIADSIVATAGGLVNVSDIPAFRLEWKREANDILMDVLHDYVGAGAPPQMLPYTQQAMLGNLPAGSYSLTARLLSSFRDFPGPTYEDPWNFPPTDIRIVSTLSTTFTVVPEPSTAVLMIGVAAGFFAPRRRAYLSRAALRGANT